MNAINKLLNQSYLHGVVGVFVVKDESFLAELVVSLQLVNVTFVVHNVLLILLEVAHLVFQRASNVNGDMADFLYMSRGMGWFIVLQKWDFFITSPQQKVT